MPDLLVFKSRKRIAEVGRGIEPRYGRRLSDQITASFYEACRIGNLDAAWQLMQALEWEVARSSVLFRADMRKDGDDLAAVQARYRLESSRRGETPGPG
jgi:hypothetical protein